MTKDNAIGAGMELPPFGFWALALTTEQRGYVIAYAQLACTDAIRFLAESRAHNANLEAQVERMRLALKKIAAIENCCIGTDWQEIEEAREIARAALKP